MTEPLTEAPLRRIIHVDMDAFYASVEQRDNPDLRGQPVAVGGARERGVVAAASYEARKFGVRSAMPSSRARRMCPDLIFVKPRFEVYRDVSRQIRAIFARYTALIEPLSLDEAYLDVTDDAAGLGSATATAERIRAEIRAETGLTASAGVSYNKFIAKMASDQNKPDGLCVIPPGRGPGFVASLPVKRFYGVGPKTAEKMARLGIETGADLRAQSLDWLNRNFGSWGEYLHGAARGIDHREVRNDRPRKSVSAENTFFRDLVSPRELIEALDEIIDTVWPRIVNSESRGRTVTLKLRYNDFHTITRTRSFAEPVLDRNRFTEAAHGLLLALCPVERPIRLLGLTLSSLEQPGDPKPGQLDLGL